MLTRPTLAPHARLLFRAPDTIQVGVCPQSGIVLTGLTDSELTLLTMLDGSRDVPSLRRLARGMQADPARVTELLDQLAARGLLREGAALPRPDGPRAPGLAADSDEMQAEAEAIRLRHRLPSHGPDIVTQREVRHILVDGHGNLADAVALTLRHSGFGRVSAGVWAAADATFRHRTNGRATPKHPVPDLVVLVVANALHPADVESWRRVDAAVLAVIANGAAVDVGPLFYRDGPCARCLDLYRSDKDPAWPELLAQLAAPQVDDPPPTMVSSAVAALAAGATATLAADYLDLHAVAAGLAFGILPQSPYLLRRRWSPHPRCSCPAATVTMSA